MSPYQKAATLVFRIMFTLVALYGLGLGIFGLVMGVRAFGATIFILAVVYALVGLIGYGLSTHLGKLIGRDL